MNSRSQTALGKKLAEIRKRIVASGVKLLSWDKIMKRLGRK